MRPAANQKALAGKAERGLRACGLPTGEGEAALRRVLKQVGLILTDTGHLPEARPSSSLLKVGKRRRVQL